MTQVTAVRGGVLGRLMRRLSMLLAQDRAPAEDANASLPEAMSASRLRDLGFQADQVVGSIDFAKGQHHRHL